MGNSGSAAGSGATNAYNLIASRTSGSTSLTQNTATTCPLTATQDPSSSFASSVYTCKVAGWFQVSGGILFDAAGVDSLTTSIFQNTSYAAGAQVYEPAACFPGVAVSTLLKCAVGDTITLKGASNANTGVDSMVGDTSGRTFLTIVFLGNG